MTLVQISRTSLIPPLPPPDAHLFETNFGAFVFVVDGSRVYSVDDQTIQQLKLDDGPEALRLLGLEESRERITDVAPRYMPVRSLSLAVAQKCNLGCSYCYAQEGSLGVEPQNMGREVALNAVGLLFRDTPPGEKVNLSFLGGEPLLNRLLIRRECAELGNRLSQESGVRINFSVTTNGTLLTAEDGESLPAARFRSHDQPRRGREDARRVTSLPRRPGQLREDYRQCTPAFGNAAPYAGLCTCHRHSEKPSTTRDP